MKVQALQSFDHGGARRRHTEFEVSESTGQALATKGLVKIISPVASEGVDARPSTSKKHAEPDVPSRRGRGNPKKQNPRQFASGGGQAHAMDALKCQ